MSGERTELERQALARLDLLLDLSPEARATALAELGREEPAVAAELAALLAADPPTTEAFAGAVGRTADDLSDEREEAARPRFLGDYRVLELLGKGGMGEVYRGERADGQFEHRVAIKLLKRGMDSDEILRRFLRERQILAQLTHPGVARLLDGGLGPDGRPFFVLEEVHGEPITEYVEGAALTLRQRLTLFLAVCDAVESAHQRLIVHRDLKPSNILVTGEGQVKLLDFGIAKVLGDTDEPELTRTHLRIMTPAYAAPEQILGQPVTTATDVYSLGVVLYEVLTGVRPHQRNATSPSGLLAELQRERVEKPSAARGGRFRRQLAGDLDTLVLAALEPDPARRYPTVGAFAQDLRRYLGGRPISARPATWSYQTGKFLSRHKFGVASLALAILALLAGLGVSLWQGERARRAAVRAERTQEFLISLFRAGDPLAGGGEQLTVGELLDEAVPKLELELGNEPELRATLDDALAQIYSGLGQMDTASNLADRALAERRQLFGATAPEVGWSLVTRAEIELIRGQPHAAIATLAEAEPALVELEAQGSEQLLRLHELRTAALDEGGRSEEALTETDRALEVFRRRFGPEAPELARLYAARSGHLSNLSRYQEAEVAMRRAIELREKVLPPDHAWLVTARVQLAAHLDSLGRRDEAREYFEQAVASQRRTLGPDHPELAQSLVKYGFFLNGQGRLRESTAALKEALAILEPIDHYDVSAVLRYLGYNIAGAHDWRRAAEHFFRADELLAERFAPDHPMRVAASTTTGFVLLRLGELPKAELRLREAVAELERVEGPKGYGLRSSLGYLGEVLRLRGRLEEALAMHRRLRDITVEVNGSDDHPAVAQADYLIALDLVALPRPPLAEARQRLDRSCDFVKAHVPETTRAAECLLVSALFALREGDRPRAEREAEEGLAWCRERFGAESPLTADAEEVLARVRANDQGGRIPPWGPDDGHRADRQASREPRGAAGSRR